MIRRQCLPPRAPYTTLFRSDDHNGMFGEVAVHNYSASNGPTAVYDNPNCSCLQRYNTEWKPFEMAPIDDRSKFAGRSEEHTSELQSQFHIVCRLLLVKLKAI